MSKQDNRRYGCVIDNLGRLEPKRFTCPDSSELLFDKSSELLHGRFCGRIKCV